MFTSFLQRVRKKIALQGKGSEMPRYNHQAFVLMCSKLSAYLLIYNTQPGGELKTERGLRSLSRKERESLARLLAWAERADPDAKIRGQHIKAAWDNREPGVNCIMVVG